jgi:hypothetical protein
MCSEITFDVVISEKIVNFILRMKKQAREEDGSRFEVHQWQEISKEMYDKLRPFNPSNESYLKMKRKDFGEYVREEEDEEDDDCGQF